MSDYKEGYLGATTPTISGYPLFRHERWVPIAGQLLAEGQRIKIVPDGEVFVVCGSRAHSPALDPDGREPFTLQANVFYFVELHAAQDEEPTAPTVTALVAFALEQFADAVITGEMTGDQARRFVHDALLEETSVTLCALRNAGLSPHSSHMTTVSSRLNLTPFSSGILQEVGGLVFI